MRPALAHRHRLAHRVLCRPATCGAAAVDARLRPVSGATNFSCPEPPHAEFRHHRAGHLHTVTAVATR
jgi:hypothetical protein